MQGSWSLGVLIGIPIIICNFIALTKPNGQSTS